MVTLQVWVHVHGLHFVHYFGLVAAHVLLLWLPHKLASVAVLAGAIHFFHLPIVWFVLSIAVLLGHVLAKLVLHVATSYNTSISGFWRL